MDLNFYFCDGLHFVSTLQDLPLPEEEKPDRSVPLYWLFDRDPAESRVSFCVSDFRQLTAKKEDFRFLVPNRISGQTRIISQRLQNRIDTRTLQAVNFRHPRWREALEFPRAKIGPKRVNLLAVGDVGGTLLTALKLMGGDVISSIGICDLNEKSVERWVAEMGQISWPDNYEALPKVEAVSQEELFNCDVLLFAATKGIPAVDSGVSDVRMAQFAANRTIIESYARKARQVRFDGLFIVLSDPVDPLCRAAYLASNQGADGAWDGQGLFPEQIQGFGLGVMNARAADLAMRSRKYADFLRDGRVFGPHGEGLVVANSIDHYDDALSRTLTQEVLSANQRIRALGFKPYVAPAVSSGAIQLLLLLRNQWHYGSVCLGGVWIGCRNRCTPTGLETETLSVPDALYDRLTAMDQTLRDIL